MSADLSSLSPEELQALLDGPALPPPPGVVPNLDNPPNHNDAGLATIIVLLALATIAMGLYAYGRIFHLKRFHVSDIIGCAAYVVFVAFIWANLRVYLYTGFFIHQWNIRLGNINQFVLSYTYGIIFYLYTIMLAKVAILLQWIRIFVPRKTRNFFFWTACVLMSIVAVYYTAASLVIIIPCAPFEKNIDVLATCSPGAEILDLFSASINLVLDIAILLLPQRVIWKLQMSRRRRMGISFVFAIGALACVAALARTGISIYYYSSPDFAADSTYSLSYSALIPLVESTFGILVFCIPGAPKGIQAVADSKIASSVRSWTNSSVQALRSKASHGTLDQASAPGAHDFSVFESAEKPSFAQSDKRPSTAKTRDIPEVPPHVKDATILGTANSTV
ncbi:hypothetical protein F5Y10DRAFT_263886 [Nemania abortiva]|nr:hypothetical protein F5Y10DRAFT_263886 [Nemania abortiva]